MKKAPRYKASRHRGGVGKGRAGAGPTRTLRDLPNIGPAMERDLHVLGISRVDQLARQDPLRMYRRLCRATGARQDPCVLDVFMSAVASARGEGDRPWWKFTARRKAMLTALGSKRRK